MLTKRTGFHWPWHPLQVTAWFLGGLQTGIAYGVMVDSIGNSSEKICFVGLFTVVICGTGVLALLTMLIDPTDSVVYKHQDAMLKGSAFDEGAYELICTSCQTNVSKASKHCARCARCIADFDHHCKWLNTCIGGRNYRYFVTLLVTLEATQLVLIVFAVSTVTDKIDQSVTGLDIVKLVLMVSVAGLAAIVAFVTSQLILFHLWLRYKGWTTYDYIKSKRQQRVKPTRVMQQISSYHGVISTKDRGEPAPAAALRSPPEGDSFEESYSHFDISPPIGSLS